MSRHSKGNHYHHGDLRAALIATAIELIQERGLSRFSLAEASRRLEVAVSAPYAHFADRDDLLAAVAVQIYERFYAQMAAEVGQFQTPADRLAALTRAYVRFAVANRSLFELLYTAGLDKRLHPELAMAKQPLLDVVLACVQALADDNEALSSDLTTAVEATAYGHAMLLFSGEFGQGEPAVEDAAERAARATLALVESRHLLSRPSVS